MNSGSITVTLAKRVHKYGTKQSQYNDTYKCIALFMIQKVMPFKNWESVNSMHILYI